MPPLAGPDGQPVLDVLVVGGGMCGQAAGFALMREGVRHLRIVERKPEGQEGPWATFARMETLRSPKHLTGPDLGVPEPHLPRLVQRAAWRSPAGMTFYKIPRLDWAEYLLWVRRTAGIQDRERD